MEPIGTSSELFQLELQQWDLVRTHHREQRVVAAVSANGLIAYLVDPYNAWYTFNDRKVEPTSVDSCLKIGVYGLDPGKRKPW